ncbi:MAG: ATP-dependent zinc metalloprotease FtsH [Gemmatimonadetes bacterium]|jgi:cell division protease FtsH|nr:ATP-dependent zinc metalloprotease FtsH [Gemmatimonadota bacterium]MBK8646017.1 ATP-dependent zinc metalloprotease FtsH [Gemmatimonadota bacterium]MBP9106430.1 ATP-dependent zinc metalloprotease FtsH [Gemmatimonadaceae bacterium]HNV74793.1 ATP-dependent zinc metalloprotease FtsH [Gemmatimonadaceae bacterium]
MPPIPPKKQFNWGRFSKGLSFWILVILIPVAVIQFSGQKGEPATQINYSDYRSELDRGNIAKATIRAGQTVTGEFTQRIMVQGREVKKFTVKLPMTDNPEEVSALREKKVVIDAQEARPSVGTFLLNFLPYFVLIGIWIFLFRQIQAGGAKAFSFGKSKAKLLTGDTPKVTFADVSGCDEAKVELQEIIEFLKDPQKFTKLGGRLPKGALLIGPPGTGKTLLAKAVAGEAGRPFFSMSGSDFVEMFVGVGASRVRDLFEQGKAHAPCIIFIDEIDAVGRHRGAGLGGGHDEREQTLNQLLVEMDGFESNDGVILIAATNRPDVLDPALLRPGRFDRQIVVDAPDLRGREGILRVHLRNKPIADDVDVNKLARGTPGMAGADLANLVNEGALLAARRGHDKIYMTDLEEAKDKVMLGAERKSLVMKEEERRLTAYHEAGHAVCAVMVKGNDPLHKVTIVPRGRALGVAFTLPEDDRVSVTREQLEARLVMAYGGRAAEEIVFGRDRVTTGAASDIQQATAIARRYVTQWGLSDAIGPILVGDNEQEVFLGQQLMSRREVSEKTAQLVDSEVKKVIDDAFSRATQTLTEHRALLDAVAAMLLERETLTREDFEFLVRGEKLPPRAPLPPSSLPPVQVAPIPMAQPKPSAPPLLGGPEISPA